MLHTYNIILMIYDNMMIYFIVDDCSVKLPLKKKKNLFHRGKCPPTMGCSFTSTLPIICQLERTLNQRFDRS